MWSRRVYSGVATSPLPASDVSRVPQLRGQVPGLRQRAQCSGWGLNKEPVDGAGPWGPVVSLSQHAERCWARADSRWNPEEEGAAQSSLDHTGCVCVSVTLVLRASPTWLNKPWEGIVFFYV
jgi:hypothetical protein